MMRYVGGEAIVQKKKTEFILIYIGLPCFTSMKEAGFGHTAIIAHGKDLKKTARFKEVNTIPGNLKSALCGACHKLSITPLPRHLGAFQYRLNRRLCWEIR